jgi:hypothetical protein
LCPEGSNCLLPGEDLKILVMFLGSLRG